MKKIRIGIMISGTGTNMRAIKNACEFGKIDGEVVFVGADNPDAKGLAWAKKQGVPIFVVNYQEIRKSIARSKFDEIPDDLMVEIAHERSIFIHNWFKGDKKKQLDYLRWKIAAEFRIIDKIKKYKADLLVLAGFMQVCTAYLIDNVNYGKEVPRIMNIHPALLPAFPGTDGYGDTFKYGCKIGGCTVHFVDYGEDTGPIIGQRTFPIIPRDTVDSIKERGLLEEYKLFPQCIQLFAQNRLRIMKMIYHFGHLGGPDDREYSRKVVEILDERRQE